MDKKYKVITIQTFDTREIIGAYLAPFELKVDKVINYLDKLGCADNVKVEDLEKRFGIKKLNYEKVSVYYEDLGE